MLFNIFGVICKGLGEVGLNKEFVWVVMEKLLGKDLVFLWVIND